MNLEINNYLKYQEKMLGKPLKIKHKIEIALDRFYMSDARIMCITPDETDGKPYTLRVTTAKIVRDRPYLKMKVVVRGVETYVQKIDEEETI